MRQFIFGLLKFAIPFCASMGLFFLYAEYTLYHYPSTFQTKANYINQNKNDIGVLTLGSSHNQNAINPDFIKSFNCSNLAFGRQDLRIDSALLFKVTSQLPNLKIVIFELSYHTLELINDSNYHRNTLYLRFHDLNLFERNVHLKDYSIYLSNPRLYNRLLNPLMKGNHVNKYGFTTEISTFDSNQQRFKNLNYNKEIILNDTSNLLITRHKYENVEAFVENTRIFNSMIKYCIDSDIVPIIISPPVFENYYASYLITKENRRKVFIHQLMETYSSLIYIDYEQRSNFSITDFRNEDHLNIAGANKFSRFLDNDLLKIKKSWSN